MNVLLVNSPSGSPSSFNNGLAYVAGAIKQKKHKVRVLDCNLNKWVSDAFEHLEEEIEKNPAEIIGLTGMVTQYNFVKELSIKIKKKYPSIILVLGGIITKTIPEQILEETPIDILVIGSGEETIQKILNRLENKKSLSDVRGIIYKEGGEAKKNPPLPNIKKRKQVPSFYEAFNMKKYIQLNSYKENGKTIKSFPIITGYGCPYHCTFCISDCFCRFKSMKYIFKEIDFLIKNYDINEFVFKDELAFLTEERVDEFCRYYKKRYSFKWRCAIRVDRINESMLIKMKQAGCRKISYGFESGSQTILDSMKKGISVQQILKVVEMHKKHKVLYGSGFIIGMPKETKETIQQTVNLCIKLGATTSRLFQGELSTQFFFATPFPHTELYNEVIREGKIKNIKQYLHKLGDCYLLASTLDNMLVNLTDFSDEELLRLKYNAERRINFIYFKNNKLKCIKSALSKPPKLILRVGIENLLTLILGDYSAYKKISKFKKFIRKNISYIQQRAK